jgi:hypothetical protein
LVRRAIVISVVAGIACLAGSAVSPPLQARQGAAPPQSGQNSAPPKTTALILGQVIDGTTGQPISEAVVTLSGAGMRGGGCSGTGPVPAATQQADGAFRPRRPGSRRPAARDDGRRRTVAATISHPARIRGLATPLHRRAGANAGERRPRWSARRSHRAVWRADALQTGRRVRDGLKLRL